MPPQGSGRFCVIISIMRLLRLKNCWNQNFLIIIKSISMGYNNQQKKNLVRLLLIMSRNQLHTQTKAVKNSKKHIEHARNPNQPT